VALIHRLLFFKIPYLDESAERAADPIRDSGVNDDIDGGCRFVSRTANTCDQNRFLHSL